MYAILIGICIKTCVGVWGHNKTGALFKPWRRVSGGYIGIKERNRVRLPALTPSMLELAADSDSSSMQDGCLRTNLWYSFGRQALLSIAAFPHWPASRMGPTYRVTGLTLFYNQAGFRKYQTNMDIPIVYAFGITKKRFAELKHSYTNKMQNETPTSLPHPSTHAHRCTFSLYTCKHFIPVQL